LRRAQKRRICVETRGVHRYVGVIDATRGWVRVAEVSERFGIIELVVGLTRIAGIWDPRIRVTPDVTRQLVENLAVSWRTAPADRPIHVDRSACGVDIRSWE